jgi:hypothetical protein
MTQKRKRTRSHNNSHNKPRLFPSLFEGEQLYGALEAIASGKWHPSFAVLTFYRHLVETGGHLPIAHPYYRLNPEVRTMARLCGTRVGHGFETHYVFTPDKTITTGLYDLIERMERSQPA